MAILKQVYTEMTLIREKIKLRNINLFRNYTPTNFVGIHGQGSLALSLKGVDIDLWEEPKNTVVFGIPIIDIKKDSNTLDVADVSLFLRNEFKTLNASATHLVLYRFCFSNNTVRRYPYTADDTSPFKVALYKPMKIYDPNCMDFKMNLSSMNGVFNFSQYIIPVFKSCQTGEIQFTIER